jgi:hypothetical protein
MYAYLANNFQFQPERQALTPTLFRWLEQKWEAHQARRLEKRNIAYLRTLDRYALDDMGVNIAYLGEIRPTLASLNPHVIAINGLGVGSLPTHMSSR